MGGDSWTGKMGSSYGAEEVSGRVFFFFFFFFLFSNGSF